MFFRLSQMWSLCSSRTGVDKIMRIFEWLQHENGVKYGVFSHFRSSGLKHGVSSRQGGVSTDDFATLNLGAKTADSDGNVQMNRRLFCEAVGVVAEHLVTGGQVHGAEIAVVTQEMAGKRIPDVDALITQTPGLPLMLCYADCVPLLFYDQRRNAVGLSHAGWQGTFLGIGGLTVAAMQNYFGTEPSDCLAAIGPSIGPDDYEVDEPVMFRIMSRWKTFEQFTVPTRPGRWQLDLWKWNTMQLIAAGIPVENILQAGYSTRSHTDILFSHRASGGNTGRFGALVCL